MKLGKGLYCAKLEHGGNGPYYVFNGFYTTVRAGFVKEVLASTSTWSSSILRSCPG